jgi:hypothetical protein
MPRFVVRVDSEGLRRLVSYISARESARFADFTSLQARGDEGLSTSRRPESAEDNATVQRQRQPLFLLQLIAEDSHNCYLHACDTHVAAVKSVPTDVRITMFLHEPSLFL